jgi:serine/threonine-protein kinase
MGLETGQVIRGKYRIVRLLGDGGMGSVYEATHEALGTRVALKLIHPELARAGLGQRFLQEARAAARIRSAHVVQVADVDQTEDGRPFMVLEYIQGLTLQEIYDELTGEGTALTTMDALEYAMQMFDGVEAAHEAGVVHRDLKPDNVMVTKDARGAPLIKILDFGIAKVADSDDARKALTRPGMVLGTPEYMAPEQAYSAATADVRSDVFSLGVILFEMLSGRRPTSGDEPQQIALAYLTGEIAQLRELCPDLAPEVAVAVHRAMAALPADRFQTVREMREAIEPFAPPLHRSRPTRLGPASSELTGSGPRPVPSGNAPPGPPAGAPPSEASGLLPSTWIRGEPGSSEPARAPAAASAPAPQPLTPTVSDPRLDATALADPAPEGVPPPDPPAQGSARPFVPVARTELLQASAVPAASPVPAAPPPDLGAADPGNTHVPPDAPHPEPSGQPAVPSWPYNPAPAVPPPPPPKRRSMLLPLALIGVVLVGGAVGIGVGVYYYYSDDDTRPRPVPHHPDHPGPRPHPTQRPPHQLR